MYVYTYMQVWLPQYTHQIGLALTVYRESEVKVDGLNHAVDKLHQPQTALLMDI